MLDVDVFDGTACSTTLLGSASSHFASPTCGCGGLAPPPGRSSSLEPIVRMYVTHQGRSGIWVFSLDAQSRVLDEAGAALVPVAPRTAADALRRRS
jgi:uncharacterized protein YqjF (DUF2071 family)